MNPRDAFDSMMERAVNMVLATSAEDQPNLRIVTFGYDPANPKTVYFTTFKGNQKTLEFARNPKVALLPLSPDDDAPAQIRIFGQVQPSQKKVGEIAPLILPKMPDFARTMEMAGPMLEVYEVHFKKAQVTIGMTAAQTLSL